jgi:anti-sigma factor RsiW
VNCNQSRDLLHPYLDGELDLVRSLEVEEHLQACPACASALQELQALRSALGDAALYHRAPALLRERIRASLRKSRPAGRRRPWLAVAVTGAVAASLAFVALLAWGRVGGPSADELLAQEVVSSHVRSLLPVESRLVNVQSSDQHKVKPWFIGKVAFAPTVKDLKDQDFPLVGGRWEYLDNHNAAALVYRRREHFINLFMWPADGAEARAPHGLARHNYQVILWTEAGVNFAAVSDVNEEDLRQFVRLIRQ